MVYEWPPLPIHDIDEAADILAERLQAAYDDLEAERLRVFADPRTLHRRAEVDAWIKDFQAAITAFKAAAAAEVERFLALHLGTAYADGITSVTGAPVSSWTQAHESALASLALDTYNDFLQRSEEAGRAGRSMVTAVRQAARAELPKLAAGGRTATQAARRLEERLRDEHRLNHVVYRDGSQVPVRQYATMVARTKSAVAYNAGTLNQLQADGVGYVQVFDGPRCGWAGHNDPDLAAGSIRTLAEAAKHPIAHPQCRRAFGPRPDITTDAEASAAKPIGANTGYDDIEQQDGAPGGVPTLAGTGERPASLARQRRQEQRSRRGAAGSSQPGADPASLGDVVAELGLHPSPSLVRHVPPSAPVRQPLVLPYDRDATTVPIDVAPGVIDRSRVRSLDQAELDAATLLASLGYGVLFLPKAEPGRGTTPDMRIRGGDGLLFLGIQTWELKSIRSAGTQTVANAVKIAAVKRQAPQVLLDLRASAMDVAEALRQIEDYLARSRHDFVQRVWLIGQDGTFYVLERGHGE